MTFFTVNKKFDVDARKAFFSELSTRLEFMSEDLSLETDDSHFDEMFEILSELKHQALHHRCENQVPKITFRNDEVKF